jgi:hypothetical protein
MNVGVRDEVLSLNCHCVATHDVAVRWLHQADDGTFCGGPVAKRAKRGGSARVGIPAPSTKLLSGTLRAVRQLCAVDIGKGGAVDKRGAAVLDSECHSSLKGRGRGEAGNGAGVAITRQRNGTSLRAELTCKIIVEDVGEELVLQCDGDALITIEGGMILRERRSKAL